MIRKRLQQYIEMKLIYLDAKRNIPEERFPFIEKQLVMTFEDVLLTKWKKQTGAQTPQDRR